MMAHARSSAELFGFDLEQCSGGELAGADEAGRGCLAGPLVASAVVFDYSLIDDGRFAILMQELHDSKRLTPERRENLFPRIIAASTRFSIIIASNHTIDRDGLHATNLHVLELSLKRIEPAPELCLVDGYSLGDTLPHRPLKKGDSRSACIAAASVIAKVSRDRIMRSLDREYPQYNFAGHKGYATREHREAIAKHGFCPLHRRSFNISLPPGEERA